MDNNFNSNPINPDNVQSTQNNQNIQNVRIEDKRPVINTINTDNRTVINSEASQSTNFTSAQNDTNYQNSNLKTSQNVPITNNSDITNQQLRQPLPVVAPNPASNSNYAVPYVNNKQINYDVPPVNNAQVNYNVPPVSNTQVPYNKSAYSPQMQTLASLYQNYNMASYPGSKNYNKPIKIKNYDFKIVDTIFALLSMVIGYLFIKLVFTGGLGIGTTIYFFALIIYTALYAKFKDINLSSSVLASFSIIILFGINFFLSANTTLKVLNILFLFIYFIFTCTNLKRTSKQFWSDNFVSRFFSDGFSAVTDDLGVSFLALNRKKNNKSNESDNKHSNLKSVFLGLAVALPVCLVIIFMLCSADEMFQKIIDYIFSGFFQKLINNLIMFIAGIPAAIYLFALLFSASSEKQKTYSSVNKGHHVISSSAILSFSLPVILVYLIFFFSQMPYFLSAFSNWLPKDFSYAEYARRGFFELSIVVIINLFIMCMITYFCKLKENKDTPFSTKMVTVTLSILTMILITTALSKMVMYIENYGLTRMRVYVSWFMILVALSFLLILIKQIIKGFNLVRGIFSVFVVMFFVLCFSNLDGYIAEYNISRYNDNSLPEVDVYMITDELSPACIEHILPLLTDKKISDYEKQDILRYVVQFKNEYENGTIRAFNLESYFAYNAILDFEEIYGKMDISKITGIDYSLFWWDY